MSTAQPPSERHLRFHRRQWFLYLLGCTAGAVGTIFVVFDPVDKPRIVLVPTLAFFGLMIVLALVERVRRRSEFERERVRIWSDEWTIQGLNRAKGIAMLTMVFAQVPLMFFMALVPPEPSVVGMGCMTVALGCGTWAASYLYQTRANPDE